MDEVVEKARELLVAVGNVLVGALEETGILDPTKAAAFAAAAAIGYLALTEVSVYVS